MKRGMWALAALIIVASGARADYLFLQYTMMVKKEPPAQGQPPYPPGEEFHKLILQTAVELKGTVKQLPDFKSGGVKLVIGHKFGSTNIYNDELLISKLQVLPTIKQRFTAKREKANTDAKSYDLAEWCLNHGLVDEFAQVMDDVAKGGKKTGEDKLDRAVECYTQVKQAMSKPIEREETTQYWRGRLGFRLSQSAHYSLLYNAQLSDPPEVTQRLNSLEQNMKAVYYWFALKGQVLKMPEQKMVAVLLDQPAEFVIHQTFEDEPLLADGFFAARDNVAVFSTQRLDTPSVLFNRQMQALYQQGWNRADLLSGKGATRLAGKSPAEVAKVSTLALLDKSLEEEAERAAVSHYGTRQIFIAAGLQRPNVVMPEWVEFGMASVMETPKGPFLLAPVDVRAPYWTGYGAPSWAYTRLFKYFDGEYAKQEEVGYPIKIEGEFSRAARMMVATVTDRDFTRARDLGPRGQMALLEARTHAWALCYYLAKMRPAGVISLYKELAKLPRDMEPEPNDLLRCFCVAFDVANTTSTGMDPEKFNALALDWQGFMKSVRPPGADVNLGVEAPQPGGAGAGAGAGGGGSKGP